MLSPSTSNSLAKRVAHGTLWSAAASASQQTITFLIFAVLAHQLSPLEFGVVAIASLFIDLLTLVGRLGLTEAIVQRSTLSKEIEATAFWMSFLLGVFCSIALFLAAQPIADYFQTQSLIHVMQLMGPVVLLNALGAVPEGLLKREFAFKALAIRSVLATALGGIIAIVMAVSGFGAISLVAQRLVVAAVSTVTTWYTANWWPGLRLSMREAARLLHVGVALATSSLLAVGNQRVLDGVIGRMLDATSLGFMRIAWRGFDAITSAVFLPVLQTGLPLFSRLQDDKVRLGDAYIRLSGFASIVVFPAFIGSILIAPEFILIAFGPQWQASILLMQVLSLGALTMPLIWFKSAAFVAIGRSGTVLYLNIVEFLLSFGIVVVSCHWGLIGVAWGNVIRVFVVSFPILWALRRYAGICPWRLLSSNIPALTSVALMLFVGHIFRTFVPLPGVPLLKLLATVVVSAVVYVTSLVMFFRSAVERIAVYVPSPFKRIVGFMLRPA